jgi:hypothetical protein
MGIPFVPNNTCDIYRAGVAPPTAPSIAGVPCYLKPDWVAGQEHGDRPTSNVLVWTHIMYVDNTVDIRDMYIGVENVAAKDSVWIPTKNDTRFNVVFVELVNKGMPSVHKRVYLDRQQPPWPTNNL